MAVIDSYSEANNSAEYSMRGGAIEGLAQSFSATDATLTSCQFYMRKVNSPTGNAVAKLYAHSGTFGTNGVPTGAALATSDNKDVSTLSGSLALVEFSFSGVNQYTLVNGTKYCISLEYTGGDATNRLGIAADSTSPAHSGNIAELLSGSSWSGRNDIDLIFYVNGSLISNPTIQGISSISGISSITF